MKPTSHAALSLVACYGLLASSGCYDNPFDYGKRPVGASTVTGVTYAGEVYPLLLSYCAACHEAGAAAQDSSLVFSSDPAADYDAVAAHVVAGNAEGSTLLQKGAGLASHGGSAAISPGSPEYQTIEAWIDDGAPND